MNTNQHADKKRKNRAFAYAVLLSCAALTLTGCASPSSLKEPEPLENVSELRVGSSLEVADINPDYTLLADNSTLAADGLFYVSWGIGESSSYENSDGETVDLYDANLYLLLGESEKETTAQENTDLWFQTAKTNYEIVGEEEISCNGQSYTLLTYNLKGSGNPYAHGVSVFATHDTASVCAELTCKEDFSGDPKEILTGFLDNCTYVTD